MYSLGLLFSHSSDFVVLATHASFVHPLVSSDFAAFLTAVCALVHSKSAPRSVTASKRALRYAQFDLVCSLVCPGFSVARAHCGTRICIVYLLY